MAFGVADLLHSDVWSRRGHSGSSCNRTGYRDRPACTSGNMSPRAGLGTSPGTNPGIHPGRAEGREDDHCGSAIYPRGYPPRETVRFRHYFRRKTQLLSTSIWAGGFGGRIDPEKGALGARNHRFVGESLALRAIDCAPLPDEPMMWDIMSARPLGSLPKPVGYPPIFVIWRRSGGPSKSMYSEVAGISETNGEN